MSEMGMAMMGSGDAVGEERAREAAEAAVHSPLLEDVDLMGARGILVNVTAGMDLSIGEFEEVGNTVKEFASKDATVVVGTVIDPDMQDQLRVTVVATGLGSEAEEVQQPTEPVQLVRRKPRSGAFDYKELEQPTINRKRAAGDPMPAPTASDDLDYLDIPAFLRRQAD
jgi:cell division protein FtsZ